jgi:hypothetical protein
MAFFIYWLPATPKEPSIKEVRVMYEKAATDKISCKKLINLLQPFGEKNNPLLLGYKGGATMMMAQYVQNPFTKLSYFKSGKDMLQKAIEVDERNVELRFLRFTVQSNVPAFLGYRNKIAEDKTFLLNSLSVKRDPFLEKLILTFLRNSEILSEKEKQELKNRS